VETEPASKMTVLKETLPFFSYKLCGLHMKLSPLTTSESVPYSLQ